MQRVFSTFPDGLPGAGLLLLRVAAGTGLLIQGTGYFWDSRNPGLFPLVIAILTIVSGASLLIGYLTPFAGILAGLVSLGEAFSLFPPPNLDLFESRSTALLATVIVVALVCIGPGAFSLDSRRFGRREIVIPTSGSPKS